MKRRTLYLLIAFWSGFVLAIALAVWLLFHSIEEVEDVPVDAVVRFDSVALKELQAGWQVTPRHEWVYCGIGHWENETYVVTGGSFAKTYESSWDAVQFEPCNTLLNVHPHYSSGSCYLSANDLYSFGGMGTSRFMGVMCASDMIYFFTPEELYDPIKVSLR